jgi:hypothetical protein
MELTFDEAIELLEITNIEKVKAGDLPQLEKRIKKRWHPDKVQHLNDPVITKEYTEKFQKIEMACQLIHSFLSGTYHAGESFAQSGSRVHEEPEDVIRQNAPEMQEVLEGVWDTIKGKKYKWSEKEVQLSDGFRLRYILNEDFKEDIAMLSVISFFYGIISLGLLMVIANLMSPALGTIVGIIWVLQALSCVIGFLPLSRFWLPKPIQPALFAFINFGLGVYNWAEREGQNSSRPWVLLLVRIPVLFAKLIKYLILFPLYELTKAIVGEKVVGVVKRKVNYYAEAADWYIEELMHKDPLIMTSDELFHLSYIYSELSDVKQKAA